MVKNDTFIVTIGPLDTLNEFSREAARGLQKIGINTVFMDISTNNVANAENVRSICDSNNVIGVITLNNQAVNIRTSSESIWDKYNVPLFNWLVDHPVNYIESIEDSPHNTIFLCVDKSHVEFINRIWPEKRCLFMPHGGYKLDNYNNAAFDNRNIDICYFGTVKYNISDPDPHVSDRLNNDPAFSWIAEYYLNNPNEISYLECFDKMLSNFNATIYDKQQFKELLGVYYFAWDFGITYYRQYLIKALAKLGLKIHVFGNGWENVLKDVENVSYHGLISPRQCLEYMGRTKIVLNNMPGFISGSHERVFNSMFAGAVCCSDYSSYLGDQFCDLKDIIFYDYKNLQKTSLQLQDIIKDKERWQDISQSGQNKALLNHTYENRMAELLKELRIYS